MSKIYQINYEFQADHNLKERTAQSTNIYIRCKSDKAAVVDAARWWANRHRAIAEHFRQCLAVVIYEFEPSELTEDGATYNTGRVRMVYQWKISTGMGPGVTVGSKLVSDPTTDPFNLDQSQMACLDKSATKRATL